MATVALSDITFASNVREVSQESLHRSRWAFLALCFFILAQSYTVPIVQIGPSWAVWPSLADFAIGLLGLTLFYKPPAISQDSKTVFRLLVLVAYFLALSYFGQTLWSSLIGFRERNGSQGINFGVFQVYRIFQATFVYFAVMRIPFTPQRLSILRNLVLAVYLFVCLMIALTYFGVVSTADLAPHITDNFNVGGPWSKFYKGNPEGDGLGTIGYNHSYPGSQVLMLLALYVHLAGNKRFGFTALLVGLGFFTVFITGARSGLAGILVWSVAYFLRKPQLAILGGAVILGLTTLVVITEPSALFAERTLERQSALANPLNSENLSGRPTLWGDHVNYLTQSWSRWIIGGGFGSNMETGHYSHQNYLQILMETGLVGLSLAAFFAWNVLSHLYKREDADHSIFWVTIGLMVTALNDEALYPVPHRVHFLSLYTTSLAIALRPEEIQDSDHSLT